MYRTGQTSYRNSTSVSRNDIDGQTIGQSNNGSWLFLIKFIFYYSFNIKYYILCVNKIFIIYYLCAVNIGSHGASYLDRSRVGNRFHASTPYTHIDNPYNRFILNSQKLPYADMSNRMLLHN